MAKLTDIKYVISAGGRREEISLYTTKEEAGDICKGFKLPDGTKAYAAIGDTKSRLATMKRFKIQGKVYAALTEAEKKKTKIRKVYIFKAGSHNFKVPFWAKKVHYTICGGGSGILSTNAPILDTIEKDGITNNKSIMMASKNNDPMYATIPYMGREIAGQASSMYVEIEVEPEEGEGGESFTSQDETRSVYTSVGSYNNWMPNTSSWFDQTTDNKSKGFSVYQADTEPYNNDTKVDTTPVVTRKKVVIAPTMINPDINDSKNYDSLLYDITVGLAIPPSMGEESGPFTNEGKYVRLTATKDDANFVVYNKGFKALYNVYPKSPMVKIKDISKFINDTMAKYKVNLVDKDIYHDEDNSLMVDWFVNKAYIYNSYIPFDKLYSAGISIYNDGSTPPSLDNNSLMKSVYDSAYSEFNSKSTEFKTRYDNVTYYMRKQFLNDTMFNYDYMMELKEAGTIDNMINSSMLSNMDLVDGAYDFATGHHTSPKLSETRLGAREVIFDIQCLDGVVRPLSVKYGGSLVLGWDKYFDDAYCYDVEDIDIYRAEEFTKLFNPLSGNIVPNPLEGQEKTGTWDVKPGETIVIEVGTHGLLYTEDMEFKLNKYFHDREADGICILEVEGDFEEINEIAEAIRFGNSLPSDKFNQLVELNPFSRNMYNRNIEKNGRTLNAKIDLSSQDVFTYLSKSTAAYFKEYNEESDDGENRIDLYMSSHQTQLTNLANSTGNFELRMQGYDMSDPESQSNLHFGLGAYEDKVKMNMAEDFIAQLNSFINTEDMIYQGIVPLISYYNKERTFKFREASKLYYVFRQGVINQQYIPRVKMDYSKNLDVYGLYTFNYPNDIDYRWYVSLGLYINPATAKNIAVNMAGYLNMPGANKVRNTKIKIHKPWCMYDLATGTVKYKVPKNTTTNSLVGIIPVLDVGIRNVIVDITNIGDVAMDFSPVLATRNASNPTITIIDNSGLTERKFSKAFANTRSNIYGSIKFKPETMKQFATGSTVDLSNVEIDTSNATSFERAFEEFSGKLPRNMDISKCLNFKNIFYNTNFSVIDVDVFKDGTFRATKRENDNMELSNVFVDFSGKDTTVDVWKFLINKVRLLEQIKGRQTVNMSNFMTYLRAVPFFSLYDIYIAAIDNTFVGRQSFATGYMCSGCTFKEFEAPILPVGSTTRMYNDFTLNAINVSGIDKLTFIQPPTITVAYPHHLIDDLTNDRYVSNFISTAKNSSNKIKLPSTITVKLRRNKILFNESGFDEIKTALNTTYLTPKENITITIE